MNLHKVFLFAVLALGAAFLVYNALSIVNDDGGPAARLHTQAEQQRLTERMF
jgi:hypothetical protein